MDSKNVAGFDWDEGNQAKCQKHGVTLAEIESVFAGTPSIGPDVAHSMVETRFLAIGRASSGRHVFLAFTWRDRNGGRRSTADRGEPHHHLARSGRTCGSPQSGLAGAHPPARDAGAASTSCRRRLQNRPADQRGRPALLRRNRDRSLRRDLGRIRLDALRRARSVKCGTAGD